MNPFMITTNQSYGLQLNEFKEVLKNKSANDGVKVTKEDEALDMKFLFTRESDRIGEGVSHNTLDHTVIHINTHIPYRQR